MGEETHLVSGRQDGPYQKTSFAPVNIVLANEKIEELIERRATPRVFISIEYQDFMEDVYFARFCWQWDREPGATHFGFIPDRNVPTEYTKKFKQPQPRSA